MAFVLQGIPSFKENLGRGLSQGISQTVNESIKQRNKTARINALMGLGPDGRPLKKTSLFDQNTQEGSGGSPDVNDFNPEAEGISAVSGAQHDPFRLAKVLAGEGYKDLSAVAMEEGKIAEKRKMEQEERDYLPKKEYDQYAAKRNLEHLERADQLEKDAPNTEFALGMVEDALGDANKWAAARDWLADRTNFPGLKSAAGAELDSAIKNYFLGDLSSIKGGRPNVFIEKQIRDAYMKAGQDPISNQKILLGMKMKEQINRAIVDKTRDLEKKYTEKLGHLPSNFSTKLNESLKPEVSKIEKEAIDKLHKISDIQKVRNRLFRGHLKSGETLMMSPEGKAFAVKQKEVKMYRDEGYIPLGKKA